MPDTEEYRQFGDNQYDPRLTKIGDTFYMTFCVHGSAVRMGLMTSRDLVDFEWRGFITGNGFRNTVLFPEKIGGRYAALERPNAEGEIWYTESPDLVYWGQQRPVLSSKQVGWGWHKIGPCGSPIRTEKGWLIVFHGVQLICGDQFIYHAGVMLTELDAPWKVIRVGDEPILSPEEPYELSGHAPTVVFASSQIVEDDGSVKLYYGASDRYQCVADTSIAELLEAALER
jgi:beta-1,4-mannooligosaccharide/beta-1,4-mannosyl-N-acetylglucosamine phosphorylase